MEGIRNKTLSVQPCRHIHASHQMPPTDRSKATNAPSKQPPAGSRLFSMPLLPLPSRGVCPVKAGPAAQSVLMSEPRLYSPSQPQAQPALPGGARLRARSVALPTTLTSPATRTLGTHPIIRLHRRPAVLHQCSLAQDRRYSHSKCPAALQTAVVDQLHCRRRWAYMPVGTTVVDVIFALITGTSHESEPRAPIHVVDKAGSLHSAKGGSIPC